MGYVFMANTMLEAAYADLVAVDWMLNHPVTDDDSVLGVIGYHLQQAVEKSLKALLEYKGEDYRSMGHSIGKCLRAVNNHLTGVVSDATTQHLQPYVNILTDWESAGRYPSSFIFTLTELKSIWIVAQALYNDCADYFGKDRYVPVKAKVTKLPPVSNLGLDKL